MITRLKPIPMKQHIDEILVQVVEIDTLAQGRHLTNASGFLYLHNDYLFVITARHVVIDEASNHRPDSLRLSLHQNEDDLREVTQLEVPLYRGGEPKWFEHPEYADGADVVAVPVDPPDVLANHFVATFSGDDIPDDSHQFPLGQNVMIVGYPLGFHDSVHHLPLVRSAIIASVYGIPFKGDPYFITDARLHRGTSGAPVIARVADPDAVLGELQPRWFLLGIHSASLDVSNRDPQQDEPLGLNKTWYASLVPEILQSVH